MKLDVDWNELVSADGALCIEDRQIDVDGGDISIRCYRPVEDGDPDKTFPLFVWLHGGGASSKTHNKFYNLRRT